MFSICMLRHNQGHFTRSCNDNIIVHFHVGSKEPIFLHWLLPPIVSGHHKLCYGLWNANPWNIASIFPFSLAVPTTHVVTEPVVVSQLWFYRDVYLGLPCKPYWADKRNQAILKFHWFLFLHRRCDHCKDVRAARRKVMICKHPDNLVIHLKRFSYSGNGRKISKHIQFPFR